MKEFENVIGWVFLFPILLYTRHGISSGTLLFFLLHISFFLYLSGKDVVLQAQPH